MVRVTERVRVRGERGGVRAEGWGHRDPVRARAVCGPTGERVGGVRGEGVCVFVCVRVYVCARVRGAGGHSGPRVRSKGR